MPPGLSVRRAVDRLSRLPGVRYAEPNYIVTADQLPNDPYFGQLWGMASINAPQAWDLGTNASNVLVAVIDSGIDYNHPDLNANIWRNPLQVPCFSTPPPCAPFCPPWRGCDYVNNDTDAMDDLGHGTHVAGTIGAVGNNGVGVTGVAWRVKLVPIKFLDAGGFGTSEGAIQAIDFAIRIGADIANNSWGGSGASIAMAEVIEEAAGAGMLFVASAGNSALDTDYFPQFPAKYSSRNVVSVAALAPSNEFWYLSNYGKHTVDLGAPGQGVLSTFPGAQYVSLSGTSMAAPHVSGAAALLLARQPYADVRSLKQLILDHVTPEPLIADQTATGGRLNAFIPDASYQPQLDDLAFPAVRTGLSAQLTLFLTNPLGEPPLTINKIETYTGAFSASPPPSGPLMPGQTHVITVTFQPTGAGLLEDTLTVATDNPDWPVLESALKGVGGAPSSIEVQPAALDVDSDGGHAVLVPFTLWTGHATLPVGYTIAIDYPGESGFIAPPSPGSLAPSSGDIVNFLFVADVVPPGGYTATIVVTFGAPFNQSVSIPVTFEGARLPPM